MDAAGGDNASMEQPPLKLGIVCYPTIGGSGVVATEIATHIAKLGHQVHLLSYDRPTRLAADSCRCTLPRPRFGSHS